MICCQEFRNKLNPKRKRQGWFWSVWIAGGLIQNINFLVTYDKSSLKKATAIQSDAKENFYDACWLAPTCPKF